LQSDLEHIRRERHTRNIVFPIVELGGSTPKVDRIRRPVPLFEQGKFLIPRSLHRTLYDKTTVDLIRAFVEEEYCAFPVARHDDMLDCLARILDDDLRVRRPLDANDRRHRPVRVHGSYGSYDVGGRPPRRPGA
jgi:hypothetical protein